LDQQGFKEQWEKIISNTKSEKQLSYQQKIWFDGFKTLKLIHHLRDMAFPQINMFEALDRFFLKLNINEHIARKSKALPVLETQKEYLRILKSLDN